MFHYTCAARLQYKMQADSADTFHDIVEGDNICPEEYCGPNCKGFVATKGWDPVTGLGTPNAAARVSERPSRTSTSV